MPLPKDKMKEYQRVRRKVIKKLEEKSPVNPVMIELEARFDAGIRALEVRVKDLEARLAALEVAGKVTGNKSVREPFQKADASLFSRVIAEKERRLRGEERG